MELKQEWVRSIRQVIQERRGHLRGALREPIPLPKTPNPTLGRQRSISRRSADTRGEQSPVRRPAPCDPSALRGETHL